jgi:hypothetical protein
VCHPVGQRAKPDRLPSRRVADALEALHELKAKGLMVIPITGRPVGWSIPFAPVLSNLTGIQFHYIPGDTPLYTGILHILTFLGKVFGCILFFIWVRWTLPRFRFDQLMKLGWLVFFELALANVILTAALLIWFPMPLK